MTRSIFMFTLILLCMLAFCSACSAAQWTLHMSWSGGGRVTERFIPSLDICEAKAQSYKALLQPAERQSAIHYCTEGQGEGR